MKGLLLILGVMVFYLVEKVIVMLTEHYGAQKPKNKNQDQNLAIETVHLKA
jgi:hypothetical protein